jgi:Fe-S-cluster containining protein
MTQPRLAILNATDAAWWDERRKLPRFMEPREFSTNPCNQCPGHCCQPVGALSVTEAVRMFATLELSPDLVVERRPADPNRVKTRREPEPIALEGEGEVQLFMRLKDRWCPFLHHVGTRGMCSIYALRPAICRVYPFELVWDGTHMRVGTTTYCPSGWLQDDETRTRLEATMVQWDADVALHQKVLRSWKRRKQGPRTWEAFVEHAVRTLAKPLGLNAQRLLQPPRRGLSPVLGEPMKGSSVPSVPSVSSG